MEISTTRSQAVRTAAILFIVICLLTIMILGQEILIPFTWAFVFSFIMLPLSDFLERRRFSRALSSAICTLVFLLVGSVILFFLVYETVNILRQEGALYEKLKAGFENFSEMASTQFGITLQSPDSESSGSVVKNALAWLKDHMTLIKEDGLTLMLIPMYLFFILNYRGLLHRFAQARFKDTDHDSVKLFFQKSQISIQNYLQGTLILTGVSAVLSYVILLSFGIRFAFFFAVLIAIFNLLPYIGHHISVAIVLVFVWITKESIPVLIFCGLSFYVANAIIENILRPKLVGDKMEMNAMMVFTSVIIGGMVWGLSGMVLFIPLLGVLQAMLYSRKKWNAYTVFFKAGDEPKEVEKIE
jgi:predicted PurR-regulated permease PerM